MMLLPLPINLNEIPYLNTSPLQLAYQKGFAFYSLKQLDSASVYFAKVSSESPFSQNLNFGQDYQIVI
jgi:hypothetical protein